MVIDCLGENSLLRTPIYFFLADSVCLTRRLLTLAVFNISITLRAWFILKFEVPLALALTVELFVSELVIGSLFFKLGNCTD